MGVIPVVAFFFRAFLVPRALWRWSLAVWAGVTRRTRAAPAITTSRLDAVTDQ